MGICTLSYRRLVIGGGTVRSFFIDADDVVPQQRPETLRRSAETTFADLLAVHICDGEPAAPVLAQRVDRNLNNDIDIVHGGVAAAGLELAASAAVNRDHADGLLQTASVRVNFLRPFFFSPALPPATRARRCGWAATPAWAMRRPSATTARWRPPRE